MKLSLAVATLGRTQEVEELFESFARQPFRDFEVILVDQNKDDRLAPVVARYASHFPVRHIRSDVQNASHARNVGLGAATGELVGFPDDDCLYQPDTMERVVAHFDRDLELGFLGSPCVSPEGGFINGRWTPESCAITDKTVWTTLAGYSMWMRTAGARAVGGFDPAIGPGTPWGSSEEPDFALRLLRRGYRGEYDAGIGIFHPDKSLSAHATARAFHYGAGMGRVLRRHRIAPPIALTYFYRPIGGLLLSLARGRRLNARYYWGTLRGRLFGYMAQPARESSHV